MLLRSEKLKGEILISDLSEIFLLLTTVISLKHSKDNMSMATAQ